MTDFGASFKKARESKGISLAQIATETRISTRFLTAIENEEFHLLPGGIFNRGFIRTYAERVGLDPEQALAGYERLSEFREPTAEPLRAMSAQAKKAERNLYPIAIGALALLILIFYIATRESRSTVETPNTPAPVAAPAPAPPATPPETTAAAPEPEPAPAAEALAVEMEVRETTWIRVTTDRNNVVPGEILQPGMTRRFTAQNAIDLIIGNAGGLTLKVNNQAVKALGKSGQVREFTITPKNVKDIIG